LRYSFRVVSERPEGPSVGPLVFFADLAGRRASRRHRLMAHATLARCFAYAPAFSQKNVGKEAQLRSRRVYTFLKGWRILLLIIKILAKASLPVQKV